MIIQRTSYQRRLCHQPKIRSTILDWLKFNLLYLRIFFRPFRCFMRSSLWDLFLSLKTNVIDNEMQIIIIVDWATRVFLQSERNSFKNITGKTSDNERFFMQIYRGKIDWEGDKYECEMRVIRYGGLGGFWGLDDLRNWRILIRLPIIAWNGMVWVW